MWGDCRSDSASVPLPLTRLPSHSHDFGHRQRFVSRVRDGFSIKTHLSFDTVSQATSAFGAGTVVLTITVLDSSGGHVPPYGTQLVLASAAATTLACIDNLSASVLIALGWLSMSSALEFALPRKQHVAAVFGLLLLCLWFGSFISLCCLDCRPGVRAPLGFVRHRRSDCAQHARHLGHGTFYLLVSVHSLLVAVPSLLAFLPRVSALGVRVFAFLPFRWLAGCLAIARACGSPRHPERNLIQSGSAFLCFNPHALCFRHDAFPDRAHVQIGTLAVL